MVLGWLVLQCLHYLFSQGNAALATLCPYLGQSELASPVFAELLDISIFCLGIGYEGIESNHHRHAELLEVLNVLLQIDNALFKGFQILS